MSECIFLLLFLLLLKITTIKVLNNVAHVRSTHCGDDIHTTAEKAAEQEKEKKQ